MKSSIMPTREKKRRGLSKDDVVTWLLDLEKKGINPTVRYNSKLTHYARKHFGLFNKAKEEVGLKTYKVGRSPSRRHPAYDKVNEILKEEGPLTITEIRSKLSKKHQIRKTTDYIYNVLGVLGALHLGKNPSRVYYIPDQENGIELARKRLDEIWKEVYEKPLELLNSPKPLSFVKRKIKRDVINYWQEKGEIGIYPIPVLNYLITGKGKRIKEGPLYVIRRGQEKEFARMILSNLLSSLLDSRTKSSLTEFSKQYAEKIRRELIEGYWGGEDLRNSNYTRNYERRRRTKNVVL